MPRIKPTMEIKRVLRRGNKNSRVLLQDGTEVVVSNDSLRFGSGVPVLSLVKSSDQIETVQTVQERFDHLEKLVAMVVAGQSPSVIICGDAGIGKTYLVRQQLQKAGLAEQVVSADASEKPEKTPKKKEHKGPPDRHKKNTYFFVKGYSSPMGLYQVLHDNRSAIIVFDDCDSIFKAPVSVNILKSALDSYDTRIVSWMSVAAEKMGLDSRFEFKGKIIFISNLTEAQFDEAVKSRSFLVNIHLSRKEIWERMESLLCYIEPRVDVDMKSEVLNFVGMNYEKFKEFNMRTLIKAIRIRQSGTPNWKAMILSFA